MISRQPVRYNKQDKRELVLRAIRGRGEISRMDLARRLGISASSITALVDELVQRQYLMEKGAGESSGGRRPTLLSLRPEVGYVVGVDYEPAVIRLGVFDFAFHKVHSLVREVDIPQDRGQIIRDLILAIREVIAASGVPRERILGVGVGVPGIVDVERGVIFRHTNIEGWYDIPARDLIELELGVPAFVDNNVRLMAFGEKEFGVGRDADSLVFISSRFGIAMGLVINGTLHYGASQMAGEVGHLTVDKTGPRCTCGKRGCLETLVSRDAILSRVKKSAGTNPENITIHDVFEAFARKDPSVEAIIKEVADYVGLAIAHVVTLLNPQFVVLGGDFIEYGAVFMDWVSTAVKETTLAEPFRSVRFSLSALKKDAGTVGAALLAFDNVPGFRKRMQGG